MEPASAARTVEELRKFEETKRRKREGIVILVTATMVAALIYFEVQLPDVSPEYSMGSNIVFFLLINVNIILLGLLVFLVVRNLVKLISERKRRILGSALQGSLEIGQTYYQNSANNAIFYARQLSRSIADGAMFDNGHMAELKQYVQNKQKEYNLGTVALFAPDGKPLVVAFNAHMPTGIAIKPTDDFLDRALRGVEVTSTQVYGDSDVIRGGAPPRITSEAP